MVRGRYPDPNRRPGPGDRPLPERAATGGVVGALAGGPPPHLRERARVLWSQLVPWLSQQGVIADVDAPGLSALVEVWSFALDYAEELDRISNMPPTWVDCQECVGCADPNGSCGDPQVRSALGSAEAKRIRTGYLQTLTRAESMAARFGLFPTERARLGLLRATEASTFLDAWNKIRGDADEDVVEAVEVCGGQTRRGGACGRPAGWGTPRSSGPCRDHASSGGG